MCAFASIMSGSFELIFLLGPLWRLDHHELADVELLPNLLPFDRVLGLAVTLYVRELYALIWLRFSTLRNKLFGLLSTGRDNIIISLNLIFRSILWHSFIISGRLIRGRLSTVEI